MARLPHEPEPGKQATQIGDGAPAQQPSEPRALPYGRQQIDAADIAAVVNALQGDLLTTGPWVERFEQKLAATLQAEHVVVCANGTAALHLAALGLDLGPGDTVIAPAISFLATANAARYAGADVVFADVDPHSGLMTPDTLYEAADKARRPVSAVFNVHLNGQCGDLAALRTACGNLGAPLVNDACHALGAEYFNRPEWRPVGDGRLEAMSTFSFHPVKAVAMGEGGAIATNDAELARRLRQLRSHGMHRDEDSFALPEQAFEPNGAARPWYYEMDALGYNYRASDLNCALGAAQLGKLDAFIERRRALASLYAFRLEGLDPVIRPIARNPHCKSAWHLYPVLIDFEAAGRSRANIMGLLAEEQIGTQVHYIPIYRQPYYRALYGDQFLPGAESYYARALTLPLFPGMTEQDVERVVAALTRAVSN
ncbi:MAG: UDP-4-amino-4,6-dideoxy-N-acetyl-beta-L-altrosami ne transaminase [Parvularculaceae bacterium]